MQEGATKTASIYDKAICNSNVVLCLVAALGHYDVGG
jgi:hypothetical protein